MTTLDDVHVRGDRLRLRPVRADDARKLFPLVHGRPDVLAWVCWAGPASLAEYEERLGAWREDGDGACDYTLAIEVPEESAVVGTLSVRFRGHPGTADLGYWIGEPYRRRGFATETVGLAVRLALDALGARELVATVFVGNEGSRRALEANGFRLVHTVRGLHRTCGGLRSDPVDEWHFALLPGDVRGRAAHAPREVVVERAEAPAPAGKDRGAGSSCSGADASGSRGSATDPVADRDPGRSDG